ncbi:hypothetical protein E2C01_001118 [Portunus trituberculatus]|uniref:Uncharacterized protein n=1 Tax=Portunus trituberculatus TaxID=210409 RepID=A0A5B7CIG6_PORTR|nr:hypothetical protein [Portunus trituberculatus]
MACRPPACRHCRCFCLPACLPALCRRCVAAQPCKASDRLSYDHHPGAGMSGQVGALQGSGAAT